MNIRTFVAAALLAVGTLTVVAPASATPVGVRHRRQERRIHRGVRNGSLTWREANRLQRGENRLHRRTLRARASGGRLTWRERHRLQRAENRMSRRIYRQKHDRQRRF